jgi:hypothetical protein
MGCVSRNARGPDVAGAEFAGKVQGQAQPPLARGDHHAVALGLQHELGAPRQRHGVQQAHQSGVGAERPLQPRVGGQQAGRAERRDLIGAPRAVLERGARCRRGCRCSCRRLEGARRSGGWEEEHSRRGFGNVQNLDRRRPLARLQQRPATPQSGSKPSKGVLALEAESAKLTMGLSEYARLRTSLQHVRPEERFGNLHANIESKLISDAEEASHQLRQIAADMRAAARKIQERADKSGEAADMDLAHVAMQEACRKQQLLETLVSLADTDEAFFASFDAAWRDSLMTR